MTSSVETPLHTNSCDTGVPYAGLTCSVARSRLYGSGKSLGSEVFGTQLDEIWLLVHIYFENRVRRSRFQYFIF